MTLRRVLALSLMVVLAGLGLLLFHMRGGPIPSPDPHGPDEALVALREGNIRYVGSRRVLSTDTAHDSDRRRETAAGQHPFAAILCCSDSGVCPEFIFDQRPGSLFELRNAGNVVDEDVLGSLEYAIEHFHIPLVVVLAHKGCGAIEAVHEAGGKPMPAHLRALQDHMRGIHVEVVRTHDRHHDHALLDCLALENARHQALSLVGEEGPIREAERAGRLRVIVGLYDMETGMVEYSPLR